MEAVEAVLMASAVCSGWREVLMKENALWKRVRSMIPSPLRAKLIQFVLMHHLFVVFFPQFFSFFLVMVKSVLTPASAHVQLTLARWRVWQDLTWRTRRGTNWRAVHFQRVRRDKEV
jgi:hypothetical protein